MDLERVDALRRWSRLLDAARPGDVPAVLARLEETDLVALLDHADAPVSILICEYALAHEGRKPRAPLCDRISRGGPADRKVLGRRGAIKLAKKKPPSFSAGEERQRPILDALRAGTVTAADIVAHARPVAFTLGLMCCPELFHTLPGGRRAADDMRILIKGLVEISLRDDPERWAIALCQATEFPGTLQEMLAEIGQDKSRYGFQLKLLPASWNAANILFAMAPEPVAAHLLHNPHMVPAHDRDKAAYLGQPWFTNDLATYAPLTRQLIDHILREGDALQLTRLSRNPAAPDRVLAQLVDREIGLEGIAIRPYVAPELRFAALVAIRRTHDAAQLWSTRRRFDISRFSGRAHYLAALRTATDPVQLRMAVETLVLGHVFYFDRHRAAAYVILADLAGLDAVWEVESARAAVQETDVMAEVRAALAAGSTEPLIRIAEDDSAELTPEELTGNVPWRAETELDPAVARRLEALTRAHLDGRPERWLALVDLMAADPETGPEDLIAGFADR